MDFPKGDDFRLKAACVDFRYYCEQVNPNADFKEYYTARLQGHRKKLEKYGTNPYAWPIHLRVEMARCMLILEAIAEREARQIRSQEGTPEANQEGVGEAPGPEEV